MEKIKTLRQFSLIIFMVALAGMAMGQSMFSPLYNGQALVHGLRYSAAKKCSPQ
ncbi:hypothetical protein [Pedobacter sp. UYP1]|uniref:hypothetical protein n=1 Tax=Pedobacter sp. UYP1 TaxID=1756396 RepID=UPI0033983E3C